jgi:sugar lactone lactonase YvrE
LAEGFAFPNGIAVSKSDDLVIFAETFTHKLVGIHLDAPGSVTDVRTWAVLPEGGIAGGDGMDFDAGGNLVATNCSNGTLEIYDAEARHLESIELPFSKCSNVHFFPDGTGRMLITEHENGALWSFDFGREGQMQYGWT